MLGWAAGIPRVAWALFVVLPMLQLNMSATFPVVPQLREVFDLTYSDLGVFLASNGVVRLILDLPAGQFASRFNGRRLLWISALVTIGACALAGLTDSYPVVLLSRAIVGGASAINQAVVLAWLVGLATARNRALVMGLSETGFSTMVVFTPIISGLLATQIGWRAPFLVGAIGGAVALALIVFATRADEAPEPGHPAAPPTAPAPTTEGATSGAAARDTRTPSSRDVPTFQHLFAIGGPLLIGSYALTFAIFFGRHATSAAYLPSLGGDVLGLSSLAIGLAISGMSLGSIFTTIVGSVVADRWGRTILVLPGLAAMLLMQAALGFVFDVPSYFLVAWSQALAQGVNSLPPSLVGDTLPPSYRALGMAGYRLVADAAVLSGPLVIGVALDHLGYGGALGAILTTTAVCTAVATVALRHGTPLRERPRAVS
jgi:predicted MFS family arabinose efflux permease